MKHQSNGPSRQVPSPHNEDRRPDDFSHPPKDGRRRRFFGHGELRLVILDLISHDVSHGYELIKAIETLTEGHYIPSPGVIYPTLDFLQDQEFVTINDEEGGRKRITITPEGQAWLNDNHEPLAHIQTRVAAYRVGSDLRKNPHMKRALANFKAVLDLRINQEQADEAQLKKIVAIIDRAALDIAQIE